MTGQWPERSETSGEAATFSASEQANLYSIASVLHGKDIPL
jgi:hypothetical protein